MQAEKQKPLQQDHFVSRKSIQPLRTSITQSDTKTIEFKLTNLQNLDSHEKMLTIQNLSVMLDSLEVLGIPILQSLLKKIPSQPYIISSTFLPIIPSLFPFISKYTSLIPFIKSSILPLITFYLNSQQIQIKQQAGRQLGLIAKKLDEKDRGEYVLKYVLLMAHDDGNANNKDKGKERDKGKESGEESRGQKNRLVAVQLMSQLSQDMGKVLCEQFIGLEFLSLGDDASENVRKEAIKHLPVICKMVSEHFFKYKILPFYYQKAENTANWSIRKSCADIIISIMELAQQSQRQTNLTKIMLKFTKDSNKWVKLSAYLNLGKFIYLLKGLQVHQKLIRRYLKMCQKQLICLSNQNQVPYSCAYNFPAVLSVQGSDSWPQMQKTYEKLLAINDKKIKLTLSKSLHQIAKIIGGRNVEKDLFKVMDQFLKDQNDEIKLGVVENMHEIIFAMNDEKRQRMIGIFQEFQRKQEKWRIRVAISRQFGRLLEIYTPQIVGLYLVPIYLGLCSDPVSEVREETAKSAKIFIDALKGKQSTRQGFIQSINALASSSSYLQRLQFISICKYLTKDHKLFGKYFLTSLMELKNDQVVNVRLALAELINQLQKDLKRTQADKHLQIAKQNEKVNPKENQNQRQEGFRKKIQILLAQLKNDEDEDIRQIFVENQ